MNERNVTSKDVALLAGVSQSTVSRVFSINTYVAPETKKKVLEAAEMLKYHPNAFASGLAKTKSNLIGIVKGYSDNVIFTKMLSETVYILQKANKQVIYFEAEKGQSLDDLTATILQYQIEGIVMMYTNIESRLPLVCKQRGIPVLQMHRIASTAQTNAVLPDNYEASEKAADLFIKAGFRRFVYVGGNNNSSSNMERKLGFLKKLKENGYSNAITWNGDYSYSSGVRAIRELYPKIQMPCAFLCASDQIAFGVIDTLKNDYGAIMGKDFIVVGFDNLEQCEYPPYSLSSFALPIEKMVRDGMEILFNNVVNPGAEQKVKRYRFVLSERNSTKVIDEIGG